MKRSKKAPAQDDRRQTSFRWLPGLWGLALVVLVACVYAPTLGNGFIWDDDAYVEHNPTLLSLAGLRDIWLKPGAVPQYYPLVHTTFWMEHHLWGLDPFGYHLVNLLLHAVAVLLVWRLLVRLAVPGAWLAAAIFAVHPVGVESVAWITERKNVLSAALALGALLAYLSFSPPNTAGPPCVSTTQRGRWGFYFLALTLFVGALLSKTVTASVPAVLLVIYWWHRGRFAWREAAWLIPFFCLGLTAASITVWMERTHVGASGTEWDLSLVERVLIAGRALWFYAGKLLWPWPLVFFYPRWTIDPHVAWQYLYPAAALIVLAALWWKRARLGRGPLAAVLIFAGVLLPALGFFNVYPFRFSFVADHFQYHASIALISLAAAAATLALAKAPHNARRLAPWAVAIVLLPLAGVARQRAGVYRDLTTLFADTIAQNPAAWAAHHNLGIVLYTQGRNDEAIEQFRRAIAINPGDARLRNSLGGALFVRGALPEAAAELSRALEGNLNDHDRAEAHVHLANVLVSQGHFELGLGHYRQGIALRPDYFDGLYNYAVALRMHGQPEAAAEQVRAALALQPQAAPAYHELGAAYLAQGKIAEAIGQLQRAVRLQPMNSRFHDDLGLALLRSGDARAAEKTLRRGLVLNPLSANAHTLLGEALAAQGDASGASEQFQSALQIDPRHAAAAANLEQLQPAGRRRVSPDQ